MVDLQQNLTGALNSSALGRELAQVVAELLERDHAVTLDFASVERMTPSFANAFVMVLLERVPIDTVRSLLRMENRLPHVVDAIDRAALRFMRGLRLTSQKIEFSYTIQSANRISIDHRASPLTKVD